MEYYLACLVIFFIFLLIPNFVKQKLFEADEGEKFYRFVSGIEKKIMNAKK